MSNPLAKAFVTRVRAGLSTSRDLSQLAAWVCANTRDPKNKNRPWSFKDHEFQIAILSDTSNDLVVKKPAQKGLSEVSVRMALGLIDIYHHSTAIYTLPTATDASVFAKSRFDTVIQNSPELESKVDSNTDNVSIKKIGDSFLYIRGTFTQKAAISIPADILIHDELDFSDETVLSSFTSRLGHVREDQIIRRRFSTPTVNGYGVSDLFDNSKQYWRAVKCDSCGTWQVPKFIDDVVIPGFNGDVLSLEKEDVNDTRWDFKAAYVSCPHCRQPLSIDNLADPAKREWVAAQPGRERSGYQVQSFDLPTIDPPSRTIRNISNYKRKADWVNFAIGQAYEDAETSFVKEAVRNAHQLGWVQPHLNAAVGTVVGIDVGKTSWALVGRPAKNGGLDVIHYERIKLTTEESLPARALELFTWYGARMLVMDAMPEWTQALSVLNRLPVGKAFACYYATPTKPTMSFVTDLDEEGRVVKADRTAIIGDTAKLVNSGQILFCRCPEQATMESHLDVVKKVKRPNSKGVDQEVWINAGDRPDHFAHALFFARVAQHLLTYDYRGEVVPSLPIATRARIGGNVQTQPANLGYLDRRLHG